MHPRQFWIHSLDKGNRFVVQKCLCGKNAVVVLCCSRNPDVVEITIAAGHDGPEQLLLEAPEWNDIRQRRLGR